MSYLYYPGCSLTGTAREYDLSTRAVMDAMGVPLTELEEWTCCGASAAEACSELLSLALPAINLAIAEGMDARQDVMIPCSACYLNLLKVNREVVGDKALHGRVNEALDACGLAYAGKVRVRHILHHRPDESVPHVVRQFHCTSPCLCRSTHSSRSLSSQLVILSESLIGLGNVGSDLDNRHTVTLWAFKAEAAASTASRFMGTSCLGVSKLTES